MTRTTPATWTLTVLALLVVAPGAHAKEPTPSKTEIAQCIAASESVQDALRQGKLLAARVAVAGCMSAQCPAMIRTDCDDYSRKVEAALPSVLIRVLDQDGADVPRATLTVDDVAVALDGRSLELDPGSHKVAAVAAGYEGAHTEIVAQEGMKNRAVDVRLTAKVAAGVLAPPSAGHGANGPSTGTWIGTGALGITAVAAFSIFAGMGLSANGRYGELEDQCGGRCAKSDVDALRTRYLIADVALVVGVVSAVAAGAVLIFGPRKAQSASTHTATR